LVLFFKKEQKLHSRNKEAKNSLLLLPEQH
jgi:hypothetical protein